MDEKEAKAKAIFRLLDSLETTEDAINNIASKYSVAGNEESYKINKKMLTEFAVRIGLIAKRHD